MNDDVPAGLMESCVQLDRLKTSLPRMPVLISDPNLNGTLKNDLGAPLTPPGRSPLKEPILTTVHSWSLLRIDDLTPYPSAQHRDHAKQRVKSSHVPKSVYE